MSVELLYTSAPQGLKQGSRGFCTVISTAGMPLNLATRLESLSAYRHTFPPNSPDAAKNPVCFSHIKMTVGGQRLSVLSRIADYGVDYSQRTNKIAHHVVVTPEESVPAGPAWLMQNGGIMRSQWNGQCETPASGPQLPTSQVNSGICQLWKSLTGDAGWGGKVAEALAQLGGKPTWIIFDVAQSQHLLPMIQESIALLSPAERWNATFSTYATNVPPDVDCRLRCVLAGTDDARLAAARGTVIDLTKPLGTPSAGRFAQVAALGVPEAALGNAIRNLPAASLHAEPNAHEVREPSSICQQVNTLPSSAEDLKATPSLPPTIKPPAISKSRSYPSPETPLLEEVLVKRKSLVFAALMAATVLLAFTLIIVFRNQRQTQTATNISSKEEVVFETSSHEAPAPPVARGDSPKSNEIDNLQEDALAPSENEASPSPDVKKDDEVHEGHKSDLPSKRKKTKDQPLAVVTNEEKDDPKVDVSVRKEEPDTGKPPISETANGVVDIDNLFKGILLVSAVIKITQPFEDRLYSSPAQLGPREFKNGELKIPPGVQEITFMNFNLEKKELKITAKPKDLQSLAKGVSAEIDGLRKSVKEWNTYLNDNPILKNYILKIETLKIHTKEREFYLSLCPKFDTPAEEKMSQIAEQLESLPKDEQEIRGIFASNRQELTKKYAGVKLRLENIKRAIAQFPTHKLDYGDQLVLHTRDQNTEEGSPIPIKIKLVVEPPFALHDSTSSN